VEPPAINVSLIMKLRLPRGGGTMVRVFVQLGISSNGVTTEKKFSSILIYQNKDTYIYTENDGID
jgi:hypothetical protein